MRKLVKPAYMDPHNSVDLMDADRTNDFSEMFCVAPAILWSQVEWEWKRYVQEEAAKSTANA